LGDRMVRGQLDVALAPAGEEQHARLVHWFTQAEPRPDRIFSSDLRRCRALAEALARATGAPVAFEKALREQSMGAWEGKTWSELTKIDGPAVTAYWDCYHEARPTGGESMEDLRARAVAWWERTEPTVTGKRVVLVTHIGVIRALACHFLGLPISEALRFAPATASHTSLLLAEAGAVISTFGERPWLTFDEGAESELDASEETE
ncbi:MAG: histidine phosphatase family protein, partial [Myxococcales bacterium]|nr:histidine phosphatase family protein [Myxococcales bacterium]